MSKVLVTITENGEDKLVVLPNTNTDEVIDRLGNSADDVIQEFLEHTGVLLTVETPDSSWVERFSFNPVEKELTFETSDGAVITFKGTFNDLKTGLQFNSAGQFYWKLKREEDRGVR
jgi:hypothetical protein